MLKTRKRSFILLTSLALTIASACAVPCTDVSATLNTIEDDTDGASVELKDGTDSINNSADLSDGSSDSDTSSDGGISLTNTDTESSEELVIENGQGTFTTTMMQGINRFEVFYKNDTPDKNPSFVFETNGQSYEAEYGKRTEESDPVKTLSGEDVTITPEGQQKSITFKMLAVYFDTSKAEGSSGQSADVTVNMNDSDIIIITRSQPTVKAQVTDGDETRQEIYQNPDDPGFLLKYYSGTQNLIGVNDVLSVILANGKADEIPTITPPKKKDSTKARIALTVFAVSVIFIILILLSLKNKKAKNKIKEEKLAKKKAIRKRKEKQVRENDRLSGALKAYADEYTDDEYYEKSVDEEIEEADKAAEDGLQQIPQDKFAEYSTGIKEALYTVGPKEEALRKQREALIKERQATIAQVEKGLTLTPGASEERSIVISDNKDNGDSSSDTDTIKADDDSKSEVKQSADKKSADKTKDKAEKTSETKSIKTRTKKPKTAKSTAGSGSAAKKSRTTPSASTKKAATPKPKPKTLTVDKESSAADTPKSVSKKKTAATGTRVNKKPSAARKTTPGQKPVNIKPVNKPSTVAKNATTGKKNTTKKTRPVAAPKRPAAGTKPVKINRNAVTGQVRIKPKKSGIVL